MTTVSTPHSVNQSTSRCRSDVKVPKLRTGSGVRSAFTAAICIVAPMSIAAAFGWTTAIVRRTVSVDLFRLIANPPVKGEGLGCAVDQFPKRDRRMASPLSRAQQPMDHVFLRGSMPPKSRRPLPSTKRIDLNRFYAHRRTLSKMVFLRNGDSGRWVYGLEHKAEGLRSPMQIVNHPRAVSGLV